MKFDIRRYPTCSSTNDVAKEMALKNAPEGTVIVSEEQTEGRGTKGRRWFSGRGYGLYVSSILRPPAPEISLLPLAAGLAVCEAVEKSYALSVGLRWPNDIVWGGKKLGGILCESGFLGNNLDYVILGIGLNVNHEEGDFPEEIRATAVSVKIAVKKKSDPELLLHNLLEGLDYWYDAFLTGRKGDIVRLFEEYSILKKGDSLTILGEGRSVQGIYEGIDLEGALLVRNHAGLRRFTSAEIVKLA